MEKKIIIGIIAVFLFAIVAIFVVYSMNLIPNNEINDSQDNGSKAVPELKLTQSSKKENMESVTITAKAMVDDDVGIKSITLPNGDIQNTDEVKYKVKENGSFTFETEANNGEKISKTIEISNIREASSKNPYIPKGFKHVEGEVNNGYTIEDKYGNQYVWVPVESGKIKRNKESDSNYKETNGSALELVNSVAQNYGFYIAKYEACEYDLDGNLSVGSMEGRKPLTNITYLEAADLAARACSDYEYEDCNTSIINSYAWDTTLKWIDESYQGYSSSIENGNYSEKIVETGKTKLDIKNNICDLSGNVREWTSEVYIAKEKEETNNSVNETQKTNNAVNETEVVEDNSQYRVVRGGSAILHITASSNSKYKENTSNEFWGFRMILYKK